LCYELLRRFYEDHEKAARDLKRLQRLAGPLDVPPFVPAGAIFGGAPDVG